MHLIKAQSTEHIKVTKRFGCVNAVTFVSVQKLLDHYYDFFRLCLGKWLDQM
jgi:hypothetical protein